MKLLVVTLLKLLLLPLMGDGKECEEEDEEDEGADMLALQNKTKEEGKITLSENWC